MLSSRECRLSIANSYFLTKNPYIKTLPIKWVFDTGALLVDRAVSEDNSVKSDSTLSGIIHRTLPVRDLEPSETVVPTYCFYGVKNRGLLENLIELSSSKTPTEFIVEQFLRPYAKTWVKLLFMHQISIESHGQNLLISLDDAGCFKRFFYRDMGGVNFFPDAASNSVVWDAVKRDLVNVEQSLYADDHYPFAANTVEEHFSFRLLFNITKQFVKCFSDCVIDTKFQAWHQCQWDNGCIENWTRLSKGKIDGSNDGHKTELPKQFYCRYGYIEMLYAEIVLQEMVDLGIFTTINAALANPELNERLLTYDIGDKIQPSPRLQFSKDYFLSLLTHPDRNELGDPIEWHPCSKRFWFEELVLIVYPAYIEARKLISNS